MNEHQITFKTSSVTLVSFTATSWSASTGCITWYPAVWHQYWLWHLVNLWHLLCGINYSALAYPHIGKCKIFMWTRSAQSFSLVRIFVTSQKQIHDCVFLLVETRLDTAPLPFSTRRTNMSTAQDSSRTTTSATPTSLPEDNGSVGNRGNGKHLGQLHSHTVVHNTVSARNSIHSGNFLRKHLFAGFH